MVRGCGRYGGMPAASQNNSSEAYTIVHITRDTYRVLWRRVWPLCRESDRGGVVVGARGAGMGEHQGPNRRCAPTSSARTPRAKELMAEPGGNGRKGAGNPVKAYGGLRGAARVSAEGWRDCGHCWRM